VNHKTGATRIWYAKEPKYEIAAAQNPKRAVVSSTKNPKPRQHALKTPNSMKVTPHLETLPSVLLSPSKGMLSVSDS